MELICKNAGFTRKGLDFERKRRGGSLERMRLDQEIRICSTRSRVQPPKTRVGAGHVKFQLISAENS